MKKYIMTLSVLSLAFVGCQKWTETESNAEEFEKKALENLKEVRDGFKWQAEAEQTESAKVALEEYWKQLSEYKRKAWLNTGKKGGQTPMFYFWYSSDMWKASDGISKTWLQALPDSLTCISMWGGIGHVKNRTENQKKDLEIFHKKGGTVLHCWQTSGPGLGLPATAKRIYPEGHAKAGQEMSGWDAFRAKYPFAENKGEKWAQLYARDLARHIISWDMDGYDVDWETCGDHGSASEEGHSFMTWANNYGNIVAFVHEIAKYFGPVGDEFAVKTQEEREANLTALFDPATEGFHENEKEFIDEFKPFLPENWKTKRYYLCADVPCGTDPIVFSDATEFRKHFDKHFMQDYTSSGVGGHIDQLGGAYYNSTSFSAQGGTWATIPNKAKAVKERRIWGIGSYHGQTDYDNTQDFASLKSYLNGAKRNYKNYGWTREAIRIADPRPTYANTKEIDLIIITP